MDKQEISSSDESENIAINNLLNLKDLTNVKIRFNLSNGSYNAMENYHNDKEKLLIGNFYNSAKRKWFREGDIVIGLAQISGENWLLFDISKITKDHNRLGYPNAGLSDFYDRECMQEYNALFGRVIISYKKSFETPIRRADNNGSRFIDELIVKQVLPGPHDNEGTFPGYENVNLSWHDLKRVIENDNWKVALRNQKGVYLITDTKTNKRYVGSAYGENMLLGRWEQYVKNGHGGNVELKRLGAAYIKDNFRYSILDIYKAAVDDKVIINRESWWKEVLLSREFGYNIN